jgi:DNA phosphorothioation-associated putative methyltransferase
MPCVRVVVEVLKAQRAHHGKAFLSNELQHAHSGTASAPFGKRVAGKCYVHVSGLIELDESSRELAARATRIAGLTAGNEFNVVRVRESSAEVALLDYPGFFSDAFPALARSWRVHVPTELVRLRDYSASFNPPILHRKELLLPAIHLAHARYAALTATAESLGLFDEPHRIGFRAQWEDLLRRRGYAVVDHDFVPIGNAEPTSAHIETLEFQQVQRHLTALSRTTLSAPIQSLLRDELLNSNTTFFDYGCGKGDDLRGLEELNIRGSGWDPYHHPDGVRVDADVVNLGFVINVIEAFDERVEALRGAFSLCRRVLTVSAMLEGSGKPGRQFRDGVLTGRNTFQKYFSQAQLQQFIESVLDEEAIPATPGVFYVFRDRFEEQRFLVRRQTSRLRRSRAAIVRVAKPPRARPSVLSPETAHLQIKDISGSSRRSPEPRPKLPRQAAPIAPVDPAKHACALALWNRFLELGRVAEADEVDALNDIEAQFGSFGRAIRYCLKYCDQAALDRSGRERRDEILVTLAVARFSRRRRFHDLDSRLQRDIKAFFGSLANAEREAQALLFSVGDISVLDAACAQAATLGLGNLEAGQSLQLHTSLVERLPAVLRVYIACATALFGDARNVDLVKLHIRSGKVTLMRFDDFVNSSLPAMTERIKVKLKEQDMDVFRYGEEFPKPLLYEKSRFINEEFPHYSEQIAFEEKMAQLALVDLSGYGPPAKLLTDTLTQARWEVSGFELQRTQAIPDLGARCSRFFTFRDLIEVGDTWTRTQLSNAPISAETFNALADLARLALDPLVEYFGKIDLTYGFCSGALGRQIKRGIDPSLDQHASYECNSRGRRICNRGGAAVDFIVKDEDMMEVAKWIAANISFDRLYYYGSSRPIHVSVGPEARREIVEIVEINGRRMPRKWRHSAGE